MGGRTYAGLAQPESPFGQGLRGDSGKRDDVAVHCQCKIDVPAPGKNSGQVTVTGKIVSQNSGLQRCRGDSSQTLRDHLYPKLAQEAVNCGWFPVEACALLLCRVLEEG